MKTDFSNKYSRIHCVGIGGKGLSSLAKFLKSKGMYISGSSNETSLEMESLKMKYDITVYTSHDKKYIDEKINAVIYSRAVPQGHMELVAARNLGIDLYSYPEFLGLISKSYFTIAVAGTNGKTTTTTMIAEIMDHLKMKPNVVVGGTLQKHRTNYLSGESNYFVTETCEYKRSFLSVFHNVLVITNIAEDHLDYYKNIDDIKKAFSELLQNNQGQPKIIICNTDNPALSQQISEAKKLSYTIVNYQDVKYSNIELSIPGEHNKMNASAALAVIDALGGNLGSAKKYIENKFAGSKRRMDLVGTTKNGAIIYDDFAHNPEGIQLIIEGFRKSYPDKKIVLCFEPHLYSRTEDFKKGFVESLSLADALYLLPVYNAREEYNPDKSYILEKDILEKNTVKYTKTPNYELAVSALKLSSDNPETVIVTVGAGKVRKVAEMLLSEK